MKEHAPDSSADKARSPAGSGTRRPGKDEETSHLFDAAFTAGLRFDSPPTLPWVKSTPLPVRDLLYGRVYLPSKLSIMGSVKRNANGRCLFHLANNLVASAFPKKRVARWKNSRKSTFAKGCTNTS